MATSGLYGSSPTGVTVAAPGSETSGLYGNGTTFGGTYFEWFIFIQSATQPATPTGGSWSFTTNSGTPPAGWSSTPPSAPTLPVWGSIALVNSANSASVTWSAPGLFAYAQGLPVLSGADIPLSGDGVNNQLYVQTGSTPQTIWFKESGTWTRLTGSTLYMDLVNNQTIAGTKTFSSQIQGSISGTSSNVSGTVAIANGGTGQITATSALNALLPSQTGNTGKYLTTDGSNTSWAPTTGAGTVTSVNVSGGTTGLTTSGGPITAAGTITLAGTLAIANGGTGATTSGTALTNLGAAGDITSADASIVVTRVGSSVDLSVSTTSPASVLLEQVRNTTGATLTKGTAVYISGATGQIPTVSKALATSDATSAQTLGLITSDLPNNSNGYVTIIGLVADLNTSAYTDGQQLYLSPTTAGTLTATKPYAPQHLVYMAVVAHAHPTQGKLLVKVQNGYELDELHNVAAQSPTTGQTIVWNGATNLWEKNTVSLTVGVNGTLPVANGGTGVTTSTGTGSVVLSTSPTLVTPVLGTPTSGNFSTGTFTWPTFNQNTTGTASNVTGVVAIANGGTGQTTANAAFNALAPSQTGNSGKYLTTDGSNTSWATNPLGTVTSVAASVPAFLSITGSPITTSGTLAFGLSGTALPTTSGGTGLTSFTANGVVYASSTSALTTGSALTFDGSKLINTGYNKSSYQVSVGGIGSFEASGGAYLSYASGANLYSMSNGSGTEDILNLRASAHLFYINSVEQMRLNNSGNLTLGVALSSWGTPYKVIQLGDSTSSGAIYQSISGGTLSISSNEYISATGPRYTNTAPANRYLLGNGSHSWYTAASGTAGTAISYTQAMTLDSSGNLFVNSLTASKVVFTDSSKNLTSTGTVSVAQGGTGTATPALVAGTNVTITGTWPNQTINSSNTGGTVTSVAATVPSFLSISGSPITTSGTLAFGLSGTALPTTSGGTGLTSFTANRVFYASSTSAIGQSANLTFDGTTLVAANFTDSSLTSGRVTYATTAGNLTDSANLLYSGTDLTVYGLTVGRGAGAVASNTTVGASALAANTSGTSHTAIGYNALFSNTTGTDNTALGRDTLRLNTTASGGTAIGGYALASNTTGANNVALGINAMYTNTTGANNTGLGYGSLQNNTTASYNTAVGYQAGYATVTGANNTAVGYRAAYSTTTSSNTAIGYQAAQATTSGALYTALGWNALFANTTGNYNVAVGYSALSVNTTGDGNVAVGTNALRDNTGSYNVAMGLQAGLYLTSGGSNTAIGNNAMVGVSTTSTGANNVAIGGSALAGITTGGSNTAVGLSALQSNTTASNNVAVGYQAAYSSTTATNNTAVGFQANYSNTTSSSNTALGYQVLFANTTGDSNTAVGTSALRLSSTASKNTAVGLSAAYYTTVPGINAFGAYALYNNTTGTFNSAFGGEASGSYNASLFNNTTGSSNSAFGTAVLVTNTTGSNNSGFGSLSLYANTTGGQNTAYGYGTLQANTTASNNTAVGYQAGYSNTTGAENTSLGATALYTNSTGTRNVAVGRAALEGNTTGSNNTAQGYQALQANTTASNNTAVGYQAGYTNTVGTRNSFNGTYSGYYATGSDNTGHGYLALSSIVAGATGSFNTAIGSSALAFNTTASNNTAVGYQAAYANTTGTLLTAIGHTALRSNTTGNNNTAVGLQSLYYNTTGTYNTALGLSALFSNTTGTYNVAVGENTLQASTTASFNTAVGYQAGYTNITGGNNTYIGRYSGFLATGISNTFVGMSSGDAITTGGGNTIIGRYTGNNGGLDIRTASNYIVLSDGDGNPRQIIDGSGYLFYYTMNSGAGTNALKYNTSTGAVTYDTSSARYKDNIRDSVYGLSHVMQMRSAQFEYKDNGRSDVGLIAEELQPIVPELVGTNKEGQADSVSYDRMVSVLVKAIQEQQALIVSLKARLDAANL